MISKNGSGAGFESRGEQVTATQLSPSDIGSVIALFDQLSIDPYEVTPRVLDPVFDYEEENSFAHPHEDVVRKECIAAIDGVQTQMIVEITLITYAIDQMFPGSKLSLNGELSALVRSFYRNQTGWRRDLFEKLFPKAISGRVFVNTLEDLDQMEDPTFEDFFGYVGGEVSEDILSAIQRAFMELRQKFVFNNYNRNHRLVEPYEGTILSADEVSEIWFSRFDDERIAQVSNTVIAMISGEGSTHCEQELTNILKAIDLNTITFEPPTIQQIGMVHPDQDVPHSFTMHLSAMTDILIPSQQVFRPDGIGLYITPPIMVDIKTGRQIFDPNNITQKDQIETMTYILAGAKSRVALKPNAKGTAIGMKAEVLDVRAELNSIAMRPWHYCRLYHFNPQTGEAQNLMPFIFLPDRVKDAYLTHGKRLPLTPDEQQQMYQNLQSVYERLSVLSDWIRMNKREKPWRRSDKKPDYVMPKLMKPGHQYEVPLMQLA